MRVPRPAAAAVATGLAVLALGVMGVLAACGTNHQAGAGPMAADTLHGMVEVVGAEPLTRVVLRTAHGDVVLAGHYAEPLRNASGIEVWAAGRLAADGSMLLDAFRVRAVDGVPAVDGVLELDGAGAVLVTADGDRIRFSTAPVGLRALAGQRVWISGPPGGEPRSWGSLGPGA
jgi:hypothetical protein